MDWFAGRIQTHNEYDLSSGVPVLVREQKREVGYDCSTCAPRFTTRERQNGSMRVTESRSGTTDEFLPDDFLGPTSFE